MVGGARSNRERLKQADVRLRELRLHDVVEGLGGIGLGEHTDFHLALGLGVYRPAHGGAGTAGFRV